MAPEWVKKLPMGLIDAAGKRYNVRADLLAAICITESSGDPNATRFEKGWRYFWHPLQWAEKLGIPTDEETAGQATSWGLMQVMGAVARQHGFGLHLNRLLEPEFSLEYACKHLVWLRPRAQEESDLIACYNGGWGSLQKMPSGMYHNQRYVDKVHARLLEIRQLLS